MKQKLIIIFMFLSTILATSINYHERVKYENYNIKVASDFIKGQGINPEKILNGIDFSKPVKIYQVKKDEMFIQYQTPNSPQGNFYGFDGSTPSELGISDTGWDPKQQKVVKKEMKVYMATKDFEAMISYSAPVIDDWSTPEIETQTTGKERQLFTTCKDCFLNVYKKGN